MKNKPIRGALRAVAATACIAAALLGGAAAAQAATITYFNGGTSAGSTHTSTQRVSYGGSTINLSVGINYIQARSAAGVNPPRYQAQGTGGQVLTHPSFSSVSTCFWLQDPNPDVEHPSSNNLRCQQNY
jgi:hypothetical protein